MVNTAVRLLRVEHERLGELAETGALEAGAFLACPPVLALQLVEIERERFEIAEALECLEAGGLWTGDDATGDLFAAAA